MKIHAESILLTNDKRQSIRIYRVENSKKFCIRLEDEDFEFDIIDAKEIKKVIDMVTDL